MEYPTAPKHIASSGVIATSTKASGGASVANQGTCTRVTKATKMESTIPVAAISRAGR